MRYSPAIAAFCLLAGAVLTAQQAPLEPGLVLRSTTRLVQVNVVVQDKQGRPVTDLTRDDFTVEDNGRKQQVAVFSAESRDKPYTPAAPLAPNTFSNRLEKRAGAPSSVTIILLDGLNTRWGDQMIASKHVVDFLRQIQPGDRVAIFGLSRDLRILHDYTSDSAALVKTLSAWQGLPDTVLQASQQVASRQPHSGGGVAPAAASSTPLADNPNPEVVEALLALLEDEANFAEEHRIKTSLRALEAIANHVAAIPGRKNLVWVSAAFPLTMGFLSGNRPLAMDKPVRPPGQGNAAPYQPTRQHPFGRNPMTFDAEVNRAIHALNNANLALYPVDARGLTIESKASTNIGTMKELAERTGGKAYYNRNDIQNSVREAVADASVTYTLAYYPKEQKGDGDFRDIKVKVRRPGLVVRHRKGYFDLGDLDTGAPEVREAALRDAAWSPLDATAVRLDARVATLPEGKYQVDTVIDPASITLEPHNGRWRGKVELLQLQSDAQGNAFDPVSRTVGIDATEETYRHAQKNGLVFRSEVVKRPEASTLKIVVRDVPSGNLGSLAIPLGKVVTSGSRK